MIDERIEKLPKWAQELIETLERQRFVTLRTLTEFQDSQTPSNVWIEDHVCTGEERGPKQKVCYIQDTKVYFKLGRSEILVSLRDDYLDINVSGGLLYFQPSAANCMKIFDPRQEP